MGDLYFEGGVPDQIVRISCPFGGGVGGCRDELCGVLGGGTVMLGALWGRVSSTESDERLYELVRQFRQRFIDAFGTSQCRPIRDRLRDTESECLPVVLQGTQMLVEIIEDERSRGS